jgi:hypothetical protein
MSGYGTSTASKVYSLVREYPGMSRYAATDAKNWRSFGLATGVHCPLT